MQAYDVSQLMLKLCRWGWVSITVHTPVCRSSTRAHWGRLGAACHVPARQPTHHTWSELEIAHTVPSILATSGVLHSSARHSPQRMQCLPYMLQSRTIWAILSDC
jgi:hypothetical protein